MDTKLTDQAQMEAIVGSDPVPFETLISDLMLSSTKEKQSEAEAMFKMLKQKDPESLALKVVKFLDSCHASHMCAQLLEMLLIEEDSSTWRNLSVSTQSSIKCVLYNSVKVEESKSILQDLCGILFTLAGYTFQNCNVPVVANSFFDHGDTNIAYKIGEQSLLFFAGLSKEEAAEVSLPDLKVHLHWMFVNAVNNDTLDLEGRIAAMSAIMNIIQNLPSSNDRERFQDLLPPMMSMLAEALSNGEEVAAQDMLAQFIKLAENEPSFFRRQLVVVVGSMLEIAEFENLKEQTRHMAVEFLITLVEAREKTPGMMKKLPSFTNSCFALLLKLLLDIKDEPCWHSAETEHEDAGETENYHFGQECLDRFSKALGGNTIALIAIEQLSAYMVAPEWEKRHASLIALASIAQGSSKVLFKYLEQVVDMVLNCFRDSHPRVRWAAINAISQLSIDLCPDLQEQYHNQVLPALAASMDDFQNPRLQARAAAAIWDFCESENPQTCLPYLDGIVNKLLVLLQNDKQMVQKATLDALAAIADLSKEHFKKYYDSVMPYLKTILINANDKSNYMIRSDALECISRVGVAVGKEKFRDDLKQVMEELKSLQESLKNEFDTIVFILPACGRICQCVGKDFIPYMNTVMCPLVECARLEPDKTVFSADLDNLVDEIEDSMHEVLFGDEMICIKGSDLLKGKTEACTVLGLYARILKEDFYPWISQAASILVPLLKFYINCDVRREAISAMPSLLRSAKATVLKRTAQGANKQYLKQLLGDIILAMGDALYSEPETENCALILCELNMCLKICGSLLNEDQIRSIIDGIKHIITESSRRKGELTERTKSEDFDAEEAELLTEEREQEEEVFCNVGDILITLIKKFKAAFLPFIDELSSYVMPTGDKDQTAEERNTCICIFYELVKRCGEAAVKYCNKYLPFVLDACTDESPEVRQNALYGLGLYTEYGSSVFNPFVGEALSRIKVVITHLHARQPENLPAYNTAAFAFSKIYQFHRESIVSAQIILAWLNCLPIKKDKVEAKVVHNQLCSIVERSHSELLGPNYLHLPKIVSVFTEVLCAGEDLATKETTKCMINLLRHFWKTVPAATWESASSLLLPQQAMELESILSPEEDANISTHAMKLLVL